jgi:PIN domain nuclease of toxin-antitoxin system
VRLLLDTQVVLWQLQGDRPLGAKAQRAIEQATELAFSVVSFAEIGIKVAIGKLTVPDGIDGHVVAAGLRVLALTPAHGLGVADLPMHHRDPFDRLLISQAQTEGLTIVTSDGRFEAYEVSVIDATE